MRPQQQQLLALLIAGVSAMPTEIDERDLQECQDTAMDHFPSLLDIPTPDPTLVEFLAEQTQFLTVTEQCVIPAVTGSMSAEFTSWMSSLSSWQQEHTDEISSLFEACSDVPEIASSLESLGQAVPTMCSEITWETPSPSNNDDDDNNDDEEDSSNNNNNNNDDDDDDDDDNDDEEDSSNDNNDDEEDSNNDNNNDEEDSSNDNNDENDSNNDNNDDSNDDGDDSESSNDSESETRPEDAATRETGAAMAAFAVAAAVIAAL